MPTKEEIIDNILNYTVSQLADFINQGKICREDVNLPFFSRDKRAELDNLLSTVKKIDDDAEWEKAKSLNTLEAYRDYLVKTDNGKYAATARELISKLNSKDNEPEQPPQQPNIPKKKKHFGKSDFEKLIDRLSNRPAPSDNEAVRLVKDYLSKHPHHGNDNLAKAIRNNLNLLSAGTINQLYEDDVFSQEQLESLFDDDFLEAMGEGKVAGQPLVQPTVLSDIKSPCTEVYFWGISQSGKSCLLSALLSVARSGKYGTWTPQSCSGYEYMHILANLMSESEVSPVAPGTPTGTTYDMSFNFITEENESGFFGKRISKKYHPITFIDIAGGMLNLMYKFIANQNSLIQGDIDKLTNLTNVINGKKGLNRKMHFFVLEYGAEKFKSSESVNQDTLLTTALKYIDDVGIFNKETDAIYFVITKADKVGKHGSELGVELDKYIKENYNGFYNNLRTLSKKNNISFSVIPFTIGTVMMQSYCKLDPKSATTILNKIMERTFSIDESKLGKITNTLKG